MQLLSTGWTVNPRLSTGQPRSFFAPTPAPPLSTPLTGQHPDLMLWARKVIEKIKSSNVQWVPWLDDLTEETGTIRSRYRPMLREPIVKAALGTKVYAVAGLDAQIHPADPDNPRDREAGDFARFALGRIVGGTRHIAETVLYAGLVDGCSISEPVWDTRLVQRGRWTGKKVWKHFKGKDTQHLQIEIDAYKNITGVRALQHNDGRVIPPNELVIWSHMSFFGNPQGMSDLRAAYRDFWLKHQSLEFRSLHLEKFTAPYLLGTYTSSDQKASLEIALEEAKGTTWVTAPPGVVISAIDMSLKGTADYQSAIDNCDRNMLIAIVGAYLQILEGQVSDGRGDTSIHRETSELFQWMLAAALGDVIGRQMMPALYEVNYPDVEPCTITWGSISEGAMAQRAAVDLQLQQLGIKLSKKEAYSYYGRAEPTDEADVLEPPALAPAAPMGFGEEPEPPPPPADKYIDAATKQLMASLSPGGLAASS